MTKTIPLLLTGALALSGCATMGAGYVPLVDMKGHDQAAFDADVKECQGFAAGRIRAEGFAVAGAVFTGLLGAFLAPRGLRNEVFARAATVGAVGGAAEGVGTQQEIIKRCMYGRGYNVLN